MSKHYLLNGLSLTDLENMDWALRMQAQQCEEAGDEEGAMYWTKTNEKVLSCIKRVHTETPHLKGCLCRLCEARRIRGKYEEAKKPSRKK